MPTTRTTITARPRTADLVREYRDEHDLRSMDAAIRDLLDERE